MKNSLLWTFREHYQRCSEDQGFLTSGGPVLPTRGGAVTPGRIRVYPGPRKITSFSLHPYSNNKKIIAAPSEDEIIALFNAETGASRVTEVETAPTVDKVEELEM